MNQSFKQFISELTVDIDPNAAAAQTSADVRRAAQLANRNPTAYARDRVQQAKADKLSAQADKDDPNSRLKARIAQAKTVLARLQQQLTQAERSRPNSREGMR